MKLQFLLKFVLYILIASTLSAGIAYFTGAYSPSLPPPIQDFEKTSSELKYRTVVIDAGHGGEDGGASSAAGLIEKHVNLEISQMLSDMLRASGIDVIMTREDDRLLYDRTVDYQGRKKKLDLAARLTVACDTPQSIFVSIHMNSYTDPKYSGLQVWYSANNAESYQLAQMIQSRAKKDLQPTNKRGVKSAGESIFLLDNATSPSVLVECGFLSNPEEAAKFETEEYKRRVAFTIFCSIIDFLEEANLSLSE